jgi:hypothetical protein
MRDREGVDSDSFHHRCGAHAAVGSAIGSSACPGVEKQRLDTNRENLVCAANDSNTHRISTVIDGKPTGSVWVTF